jgi:predicted nucleic acid-binding protein
MIGIDTSTWVAFLSGETGTDTHLLDQALRDQHVVMIPVVLTELLSDPKISQDVIEKLLRIPLLEVGRGYWQRAGQTRAKVLAKRRKARLADALIAQSCLDRGIPLVTRDRDFDVFAQAAGLDLIFGI